MANHVHFMMKQLEWKDQKIHRNNFLRYRNDAPQSTYKKQRSVCVNLLRKVKNSFSQI